MYYVHWYIQKKFHNFVGQKTISICDMAYTVTIPTFSMFNKMVLCPKFCAVDWKLGSFVFDWSSITSFLIATKSLFSSCYITSPHYMLSSPVIIVWVSVWGGALARHPAPMAAPRVSPLTRTLVCPGVPCLRTGTCKVIMIRINHDVYDNVDTWVILGWSRISCPCVIPRHPCRETDVGYQFVIRCWICTIETLGSI